MARYLKPCRSKHIFAWCLVVVLTACSTTHGEMPLTIARDAFGGGAQFVGRLQMSKGCVVATGAFGEPSTVLFDPDIRLTGDGAALFDPQTGRTIRFNVPIAGGAAELRSDGNGWAVADIERFFGVRMPANCPRDAVMRLHDMIEQ